MSRTAPRETTAPAPAPASAPASASAPAPGAAAEAVAETPRLRTSLRRRLFWIVVVVAAVVFALITVLLTGSGSADADRYSIGNAGPAGSMAVAEVLRQQGVDVVEAHSLDEAQAAVDDAADAGGATVLFDDVYGYLDDEKLDAVAGLGDTLVLLEPGGLELDAIAPGIATAGAPEDVDTVTAGCALPAAERAGTITRPTTTYRLLDGDSGGSGGAGGDSAFTCFPSYDDAYAVISVPADGSTTGTSSSGDPRTLTVLGAGDALTNDAVARLGNAALVLGLLGEHPTLVWYLPTTDDLDAGAPATLGSLTPGWVTPVILLLLLVVLAAGVWRGRRFGPVVVENLPVTVRASETMEGRARLYARQGAHARALDSLRIGTIARLTRMLALPRHAGVAEVSRAVASVTGRHVDEVHDVLVGALPRSEAELLAYSDRLLLLEQQVHQATTPR